MELKNIIIIIIVILNEILKPERRERTILHNEQVFLKTIYLY